MPILKTTEAFEVQLSTIRYEPTEKRGRNRSNRPRWCRNMPSLFAVVLLSATLPGGQGNAGINDLYGTSYQLSGVVTEPDKFLPKYEDTTWQKNDLNETNHLWRAATETVLQPQMLAVSYSDQINGNGNWSKINWTGPDGWQQPAVIYGTETVLRN